jgi:hypothetical protein
MCIGAPIPNKDLISDTRLLSISFFFFLIVIDRHPSGAMTGAGKAKLRVSTLLSHRLRSADGLLLLFREGDMYFSGDPRLGLFQ